MKTGLGLASALLFVLTTISSVQACNGRGNCENAPGRDRDDDHGHYQGAPGPIAGAGLPALAIGYGVYWLIKRRRRQD